MLCLTRTAGEEITLSDRKTGQKIGTVKLVWVRGTRANIGFDLPDEIAIYRDDIHDRNPKKRDRT